MPEISPSIVALGELMKPQSLWLCFPTYPNLARQTGDSGRLCTDHVQRAPWKPLNSDKRAES